MFGRAVPTPNPMKLKLVAEEAAPTYTTARGHCRPFGATPGPGGVNFAVFSRHAQRIDLVLFKEGREDPIAEIPLDPRTNKTGDVWHIFVHGLEADVLYGYRVHGPHAPKAGHRFDSKAIVLDPYALAISGGHRWGQPEVPHGIANGRLTRRGRLVFDDFDWEGDVPLATPLAETVIYELHVRGYTRHPSSGSAHPGTFLGLCDKIPHLMIGLRKKYFAVCREQFVNRVSWHGVKVGEPDWTGQSRTLAFHLHGWRGRPHWYVLFNAHWEWQKFQLPPHDGQWRWKRLVERTCGRRTTSLRRRTRCRCVRATSTPPPHGPPSCSLRTESLSHKV